MENFNAPDDDSDKVFTFSSFLDHRKTKKRAQGGVGRYRIQTVVGTTIPYEGSRPCLLRTIRKGESSHGLEWMVMGKAHQG